MLNPAVLLVPGENIAIWPEVKLQRAHELVWELHARISEWQARRPLRSRVVRISPTESWVTLEVVEPPPLEVAAALFGDALHNIRSALDAAVWEMATFEGRRPPTEQAERAVQFHLFDDPEKLKAWVKKVGSLDPAFAKRIGSIQPYTRAERLASEDKVDTLLLLNRLEITDKHRNSVVAAVSVASVGLTSVRIAGDAKKVRTTARPQVPLVNGAVIATMIATEPFSVIGHEGGDGQAQFDVPVDGGYSEIFELLEYVWNAVRASIDTLYGVDLDRNVGANSMVQSRFVDGVTTTTEVPLGDAPTPPHGPRRSPASDLDEPA